MAQIEVARCTRSPAAVDVVRINVQDRPEAALALLADLGISYPSFGPADDVTRALAAPPVLPLSNLVRADGGVRRVTDMMVFSSPEEVRDAVVALSR